MDLDWLCNILASKGTALLAGAVSISGAIGSAILAYVTKSRLATDHARHSNALEQRKAELQTGLEGEKTRLQKELEEYKGLVADELASLNARRAYEYEARKRLYAQVEPLLFQLFEAAENSFHAVASLARTQRTGHLPTWLQGDAYYLRSIIHRLLAPLVIFRLIQRSTTLLDLGLDPSIRLRYSLLKEIYLTWTDDFGVARTTPELNYSPNDPNWKALIASQPKIYCRQGLLIGYLERAVDGMFIDDGTARRPVGFGEFESKLESDRDFVLLYDPVRTVLQGFSFNERPVLSRILLSHACLMHVLMTVFRNSDTNLDLEKVLVDFIGSEAALRLSPVDPPDSQCLAVVQSYVVGRLKQAVDVSGYVQF